VSPAAPRRHSEEKPVPYTPAQRLTLLACILGSSAAFLDGTIVNIALPAIRASLHGGLATQEWVVDAYLLTLGALLLVGGSLGDVHGRRRIFAVGVAGFGLASLACAAAPDAGFLIAARAIQGVTAALLVPSTLALIMDTFDDRQRASAIGSWTAWTGIATVAGPLLGGLLIQIGSWRWVFVVNVPLVLATLWLVRHIPSGRRATGGHIDWIGGALGALGLGGPIYALIEQPTYGWGDPRVWGPLLGGLLLVVFVVWERRCSAPMLPLGMFRERNFAVGNLATLCFYGALNVITFFVVVFLQQVAGYSPLDAGLSLLPLSILTFLLAKRFGALSDRFGPRLFMGCGPIVAGLGMLLLTALGANPKYLTDMLPGVVLFGLGLALTVAPLTAAVLGAAGSEHSGVASGINNAVARVAGLIAIAVVGAVIAGHFSADVHAGLAADGGVAVPQTAVEQAASATFEVRPPNAVPAAQRGQVQTVLEDASVSSLHLALWLAALLAIISGAMSLVGIRNPRREVSAEKTPGGAICGASGDLRSQRIASQQGAQEVSSPG
jgi:EmrB/QacA subfamily drug resistance transporter